MNNYNSKLLFIINPFSGNKTIDWAREIHNFYKPSHHIVELFQLTEQCSLLTLKARIKLFSPDIVIAVGGDGTIKLLAECLIKTNIPLGILPAGSANGLAKELGISMEPGQALNQLMNGNPKRIHLTKINKHLCIHLSDIGLNAFAMKKFKTMPGRGMWGYFLAILQVLFQSPVLEITIKSGEKIVKTTANMVVIANATQFGTGAIINPIGSLLDALFEVILIKKISILEIFKMRFSHANFDREKTEIMQTKMISIASRKKVHFQIDGEYLGKVKKINAEIVPNALQIIFPNV
jgi:diacylglycerol kinase (ATP)